MSLDAIRSQASQFSSVDDLIKQAQQNYGVEKGLYSGALSAYNTGKATVSNLIGQERAQKIETILPPGAVIAKAAYKKYGNKVIEKGVQSAKDKAGDLADAARMKFKQATGQSDAPVESGDVNEGGIELGEMKPTEYGGETVPEGSSVSADGEQLEGKLSPENLTERYNKLSPEGKENADAKFKSETGSEDDISGMAKKGASESDEGIAGKIGDHTEADKAIGAEEDAGNLAKVGAEDAAEEGGAMAAESALPGVGEVMMAFTALGMLFHAIHKEHEEEKQINVVKPTAPKMPQLTGVNFDAAPVIDSSSFHQL